jgi:leucyl-tRNA synthetase
MKFLHQDKSLKERRKELRKNSTPQEVVLWAYLRRSNLGYKFERQHSIGPYIVDFYCAKKRLVIELDGGQHLESQTLLYDQQRTEYLKNIGYQVMRFSNREINTSKYSVVEQIKQKLSITPSAKG